MRQTQTVLQGVAHMVTSNMTRVTVFAVGGFPTRNCFRMLWDELESHLAPDILSTLPQFPRYSLVILNGLDRACNASSTWYTYTTTTDRVILIVYHFSRFTLPGVVGQTWILNKFRLVPLEKIDQVVMSYGGLRGAVAFALVVLLEQVHVKAKDYFVATTIIVIFFTVMFQVISMRKSVGFFFCVAV